MKELLLGSFEQYSLLWLVLSAGIGGIIGGWSKFLFEQMLPAQLKMRMEARQAFKKYRYPIIRAADALDRRLQNFVQFVDRKWYDDVRDSYYCISTLYLMGAYFGWCKILEDESFIELLHSDKRAKKHTIMLNTVYKGLTGFEYFARNPDIPTAAVEAVEVPRLAITAIGELMVKRTAENGKEAKASVLGFVEFVNAYNSNPDFQKWFGYLDNLFAGMKPGRNEAQWNRLLVFAINLRTLITFMDPEGRQTAPRILHYHQEGMHPDVWNSVRKKMDERKIKYTLAEPKI